MPLALASIPQVADFHTSEAIKANGETGSSGPVLECGSTKQFRLLRSPSSAAKGGAGASLDKNALSTVKSQAERVEAVAQARVERFALQAAARHLLPGERIAGCLRWRVYGKEAVEVWHIPETASARFGGLQTCGSVWMCPVCAAKISERRKSELETALKAAHELGWYVVMATLTIPHGRSDELRGLVDLMMKARGKATGSQAVRRIYNLAGVEGTARALEVTHGENGWHPHIHELIFVNSHKHLGKLRKTVREQWFKAVSAAGLGECSVKAFKFDIADTAIAEYVSKFGRSRSWNVEHEMTKQVTKKGRSNGHFTPAELLQEFAFNGDAVAGRRYVEYAHAMKRRAQLYIAPALRKKLCLALAPADAVKLIEKDDGELCEERDKKGVLMALLPHSTWQRVLHTNRAAELLNIASMGDELAVKKFIDELGDPNASGRVVRVDRPCLVDRGADLRDKLPAVADPFALDPLVKTIMQGDFGTVANEREAKELAKVLYGLRGDGMPVPWFEKRLKERVELARQVRDELNDPFA